MNRIEVLWEDYKSMVIPKRAGPAQIEECRLAFYAGAATIFSDIVGIINLNDQSLEPAVLENLHAYMGGFLESFKALTTVKAFTTVRETKTVKETKTVREIKNECYNANCPACVEKRIHTDEEWNNHPGQGKTGKEAKC